MKKLVEKNIRPRDIMTKEAFLNALTMDMALGCSSNSVLHLLAIANQKATQLKRDRLALYARIEELNSREEKTDAVVNLPKLWCTADYQQKKSVAMIMIHKILIREDGSTQIIWNI